MIAYNEEQVPIPDIKWIIKKFEKTKGWLAKKLSSSENQMDQLVNILEERSIWQRYGF